MTQRQMLWFIIGFSLLIRFGYAATHVSFSQDQARDVLLMEQYQAERRIVVPYGPKASVGDFYLPPLYYQFYYWLSLVTQHHPLTMHWVITLVEALTPALVFLIGLRLFKPLIALVVAILAAISPLSVIFGTFSWNPNMIPFFSSLALLAWIKLWEERHWKWIYVGGIAVIFAIHLHFQAVVLALFPLGMMVYSIKQRPRLLLHWLLAGLIGLMTLSGYFWTEAQHDWPNSKAIYQYITQNHAQTYERVSKPAYVLTFLPAFIERTLVGGNRYWFLVGRVVFWIGGGLLFWQAWRQRKEALLVLLYLLAILLMLRVYKGDKLAYYMSVLFVWGPLLVGSILSRFIWPGLIIVLLVSFWAGKHLAEMRPYSGLREVTQIAAFAAQTLPTKVVNPCYQNHEVINPMAYALKHQGFQADEASQYVVDFCLANWRCDTGYQKRCVFFEEAITPSQNPDFANTCHYFTELGTAQGNIYQMHMNKIGW